MPTTSNKPTRAAIYARVSTSDQDTGMQVAELRQVCGQRGWDIVAEPFADARARKLDVSTAHRHPHIKGDKPLLPAPVCC